MRLLQPAFAVGVPHVDAVFQTLTHPRPETLQPGRVPADAPVAVHLQDTAQLPVRSGMKVRFNWPDGQGRAELLVAPLILIGSKLSFAQRSLKIRKEMRYCLGIIP